MFPIPFLCFVIYSVTVLTHLRKAFLYYCLCTCVCGGMWMHMCICMWTCGPHKYLTHWLTLEARVVMEFYPTIWCYKFACTGLLLAFTFTFLFWCMGVATTIMYVQGAETWSDFYVIVQQTWCLVCMQVCMCVRSGCNAPNSIYLLVQEEKCIAPVYPAMQQGPCAFWERHTPVTCCCRPSVQNSINKQIQVFLVLLAMHNCLNHA